MDGWMDGWMDRQTDYGLTDGRVGAGERDRQRDRIRLD
jgi:hypothetical protein